VDNSNVSNGYHTFRVLTYMNPVTFDIYSLRGSNRGRMPLNEVYSEKFSIGSMPTIGLHRVTKRDILRKLKGEVKIKYKSGN